MRLTEFFVNGGPLMYPLLACSFLVIFVVVERAIFWIGIGLQRNRELLDEVLELCQEGRFNEVREKVQGSKDFVIRILVTGILHREFSMSRAMESAITPAANSTTNMARFKARTRRRVNPWWRRIWSRVSALPVQQSAIDVQLRLARRDALRQRPDRPALSPMRGRARQTLCRWGETRRGHPGYRRRR